jgi:hypothetical protein
MSAPMRKARAMRRPSLLLLPALLAGAGALGGCADPFERPGTWRAGGIYEDNLRAMLADPQDARRGVAEPGADGQLAAAAVTRLRTGHVKPLPEIGISQIGTNGGAQPAAAPAPTAGATGAGGG